MPSEADAAGDIAAVAARILTRAIDDIGGQPRLGQQQMASEVAATFVGDEHLLVQAGTGTGKSLGYLAPALALLASDPSQRVVVATATLALQAQLATKDIPAATDACEQVTGVRVASAVVKGRGNYACLYRVRAGVGESQGALLGGADLAASANASADAATALGAEVVMLREWAQDQADDDGVADRDDAPAHSPAAWAQVSVPVRECLGQTCPYVDDCFVEKSREVARGSQLIVTNHALLAIDALHGTAALPAFDALVVDEAHELVSRVTSAASHELSPQGVERVARRCLAWLTDQTGLDFLDAADALNEALDDAPVGRVDGARADDKGVVGAGSGGATDGPTAATAALVAAFAQVRDAARAAVSGLGAAEGDPERKQAAGAAREIFEVAERMAALKPDDVVWVSDRERFGRQVVQAPLDVASLMRDVVFDDRPVVLTSATLRIGGDFASVARSVGLVSRAGNSAKNPTPGIRADRVVVGLDSAAIAPSSALPARPQPPSSLSPNFRRGTLIDDWRGVDVGSPFDYPRQGILYIARHLGAPSRDGIGDAVLAEVAELVWAAGGRTLGLFAAQRSAEVAARYCRAEVPGVTILCQGDAQLSELTRRFMDSPQACLFGTLSLWQGVDLPGETCQLVIIDKIPFPRPDDPLMQARQQAVAQAGGNGFMAVAATHAGLLLAQGSGRLIRTPEDRGVVAVLDPRLMTARYGSFLRASMPDFWTTTDRETAIGALQRLRSADDTKLDAK